MAKNLFFKYENRFNLIQHLPTGHHSLKLTIILEPKIEKNEKLLIPSWFQWYMVKKFSALCSATTYFFRKSGHRRQSRHICSCIAIWKMVLNWTVLYFSLRLVKFLTKCFYEYKQEENKSFNSRLLCLTTMSLATKSKTELKIWWCRTMSEELLTHFLGQMENKQSILKQTDKVAQIGNSSGIVNWQHGKTLVWQNGKLQDTAWHNCRW